MNELTQKIIGAAIEVHKALGPGLLESAYEECLAHELLIANVSFERQVPLPVSSTNPFNSIAGIASTSSSNTRWFWK